MEGEVKDHEFVGSAASESKHLRQQIIGQRQNKIQELASSLKQMNVNAGLTAQAFKLCEVMLKPRVDSGNPNRHLKFEDMKNVEIQLLEEKAEAQVDKSCQTKGEQRSNQEKTEKMCIDLKNIASDAVKAANAFKETNDLLKNQNQELNFLLLKEMSLTAELQAQVSEMHRALLKLQTDSGKCQENHKVVIRRQMFETEKNVDHRAETTEKQEDEVVKSAGGRSDKRDEKTAAPGATQKTYRRRIDHLQKEIQDIHSFLRQKGVSGGLVQKQRKTPSQWRSQRLLQVLKRKTPDICSSRRCREPGPVKVDSQYETLNAPRCRRVTAASVRLKHDDTAAPIRVKLSRKHNNCIIINIINAIITINNSTVRNNSSSNNRKTTHRVIDHTRRAADVTPFNEDRSQGLGSKNCFYSPEYGVPKRTATQFAMAYGI
ncbi:hypothetical protein JOB18_019122 [Solea senegalensis]|uniref:Uncharacterized protein n=1 Tax=Solea senegalensis TaxID=28829 RepID=A0AAV6RK22_SOLSE|nr:hypothetical protein JOB18_019122 [Solea senegalensis]